MNIDKVEFEWHNIECLDPKMLMELINSRAKCLVILSDGTIEVANIVWSEDFVASLESDDEFSHTDPTTEVFREWAEEFAECEEFVLYSAEYYEEYGEYAGRTITIFDNAIEIALIPDNPIINAIYNKRLDDVFNDEYCGVSTSITKGLCFPSYQCKSCLGEWVSVRYDYCPWCGRRIKY